MGQPTIQTSFHTGEWSPALNARVDMQKYHSAAALLENFFVDYRGGASSRAGTRYILQAYKSSSAVRLITFQASFNVGFVMEFGDFYIRFYNDSAPVLETAIALTAATAVNPAVFTSASHGLSIGDWVYASGFAGGTWTTLNSKYFIVASVPTANTFTLTDLFGNVVSGSGLGVWTAGSVQRVYTLASPYAAADLALIKFTQNVNQMILCHPSYSPQLLTYISDLNWTISTITFGATIGTPAAPTITTNLGAGAFDYAYIVTAVDENGQESGPSAYGTLANSLDLRVTPGGVISVAWSAVSGAQSYNVYKANQSSLAAVPAGSQFGFIGNVTGIELIDNNISPDFSLTPPVPKNPFLGAGVASVTVTAPGSYATVPTVTIAAGSGVTATAIASVGIVSVDTIVSAGSGYSVGDLVPLVSCGGAVLRVTTVGGLGAITGAEVFTAGSFTSGSLPADPVGTGLIGGPTFNVTWGVVAVVLTNQGSGYTSAPAVSFSAGLATATAVLDDASSGNPSVPGFINQRLVLAGPPGDPQQMNFSQPAAYFNFDVTNPVLADNAIQVRLVSGQLNTIKSLVPMPSGLIVLSDRQAWLMNGGGTGAPLSAIDTAANSQAYNGANDVPPIISNYDILYVQSKGSIVRDLSYNFYTNIFTGTDITVLSSHLFYGHEILEWAYCEEPFKLIWAVRDDGVLLCLTFMKEQELIGWTHSDTQGLFKSVASCIETTDFGAQDALYCVVEREVNGQTLQYIERMAERIFPDADPTTAWCVDAGLQYDGAPATSFSGGEHLAGLECVGLADGVPITPFTMAANGNFTLPSAASVVTIGLAYTPRLQTLQLDIGEPTIQGKPKKISSVVVRVQDTLGIEIGQTFDSMTPMKDLVLGNISSMLAGLPDQTVTGLVTGDAMTILDPSWNIPGQYCIRQPHPLPVSVLGVIPRITVGDTK